MKRWLVLLLFAGVLFCCGQGFQFLDIAFLGSSASDTTGGGVSEELWISQGTGDADFYGITNNVSQSVTNWDGATVSITRIDFLLSHAGAFDAGADLTCYIRTAENNGGDIIPNGTSNTTNFNSDTSTIISFKFATPCDVTNGSTIFMTLVSAAGLVDKYYIYYGTDSIGILYAETDYSLWANAVQIGEADAIFYIYKTP